LSRPERIITWSFFLIFIRVPTSIDCGFKRNFLLNPHSAFRIPQSRFLLDYRFIHEHNRYLIANRVDPVTIHAFQAAAIGLQFDFFLTGWTAKDFEKIRIDAHQVHSKSKRYRLG
jgi:hypothetical protein